MQRASFEPNALPLTVATPAISPSAGVLLIKVVDFPPATLGGDRQRSIFNERTLVDQLRDVFPRGSLIGLAPARYRGRPILVARDRMARNELREIRANVIEIDL